MLAELEALKAQFEEQKNAASNQTASTNYNTEDKI